MRTIVSLCLLACAFAVQAQKPNAVAAGELSADSIAAALSRLAIANNGVDVYRSSAEAAKYEWKAARTSWLDNFRVAGNMNEFSLSSNEALKQNTLYPRYNIGAIVPLGMFINQGKQAKAQYFRYQSQKEQLEKQKTALALKVYSLYFDYAKAQKMLELQEEVLEEASFAKGKAEEKFAKGLTSLDVYTAISKNHSSEQMAKLGLEKDLMLYKAELEMLIGMPLQAALNTMYKR